MELNEEQRAWLMRIGQRINAAVNQTTGPTQAGRLAELFDPNVNTEFGAEMNEALQTLAGAIDHLPIYLLAPSTSVRGEGE